MNTVTFPLLNLKLELSRIAFSIGNIAIYWYAILIISAIIISLVIFKIKDGKFNINFSDIIDLSIYVIPISIISARVYYILFDLEYYISYPAQIFNLKAGGLAIYGGIIGGGIVCYIFCKKRKIDLLDLFDYIVPCLALRTSNREMGKLYKCRSIWKSNFSSLENGNYRSGKIHRGTSNILIRIISNFFAIYNIKFDIKQKKIQRSNNTNILNSIFICQNDNRRTKNR